MNEQPPAAPPSAPARVCVHIPSYNHREFLPEAIESVLKQTWRDFHIVIVDDASTDGSAEVIREYAARHPERITAVINETNRGIPRRLAQALTHCNSEFFAYLDGDDLWLPDALEALMTVLEARPEVGLAYGDMKWFSREAGESVRKFRDLFAPAEGDIFEALVARGCFIGPMGVTFRRRCLEDVNVSLDETPFRYASDYYIWLSIAAKYPVAYVPQVLALHRQHKARTSLGVNWSEERRLCLEHLSARCPWTRPRVISTLLLARSQLEREMEEAGARNRRLAAEKQHIEKRLQLVLNKPPVRAYRAVKRVLSSLLGRKPLDAPRSEPSPEGGGPREKP